MYRLFYDTVKGGDYRAREANVYRLAQLSVDIIDQCVATGVPFAREYGGLLDNRSFGGAQVSRTFYARGQTGQQLLLGAYQSMMRQVDAGNVSLFPRREMLDLVLIDGQARGIITRNLITGELERHDGSAVLLCTGGYGTVHYLSTNAVNSNVTAAWRAHKRGALFANPCFTQIHPTCIPVSGDHQSKLTLMSESLRNDGRVWVPKKTGDTRPPDQIPESERDYYLERRYPSFGNLVPRDVASRAAKLQADEGHGVGDTGLAVYLDFKDAIQRLGVETIKARYGNLFEMYDRITAEDPYRVPMRIYPAIHYTMGGLWVDYNLESTIPGLFVLGEANFSDHGANRLGASALMQGLADGYFIAPYTVANYLAGTKLGSGGGAGDDRHRRHRRRLTTSSGSSASSRGRSVRRSSRQRRWTRTAAAAASCGSTQPIPPPSGCSVKPTSSSCCVTPIGARMGSRRCGHGGRHWIRSPRRERSWSCYAATATAAASGRRRGRPPSHRSSSTTTSAAASPTTPAGWAGISAGRRSASCSAVAGHGAWRTSACCGR